MKNVYMDLEFTGLHQHTVLISIGLVAESGETFYAENTGYSCPEHFASIDDAKFFEENIKPSLEFFGSKQSAVYCTGTDYKVVGHSRFIRESLEEWLKLVCGDLNPPGRSIQIVGDVCTYDWVLFCNLWKHARSVPPYVYYIPFDIATMLPLCRYDSDISRESLLDSSVNASSVNASSVNASSVNASSVNASSVNTERKHNALYDAHVIRLIHKRLQHDYARLSGKTDGALHDPLAIHGNSNP